MKGQKLRLKKLYLMLMGPLALGVSLSVFSTFGQINAQQIYQQTQPAVVFIQAALSGTGFVFHPSGCILTAAHVVGSESRTDITVRLSSGETLPAGVLSFDDKNDVAVLKIEVEDANWVKLGDSDEVRELDEVVSIGFPKPDVLSPEVPTADTGRVQAVRAQVSYRIGPGRTAILEDVIQVGGTIRPGSSGGPVFNAQGEVIGIVASTPTTAELSSTAYASPINRAPIPAICALESAETSTWPWAWPLVVVVGLVVVGSLGYWQLQRTKRADVRELLKQNPLFSGLTKEELNAVKESATPRDFAKGETLVQEGDADGPKLFLILQGQVEIRSDGRRFGKRGIGRVIGEMAMLTGEPRSADVVALKPSRCLELTQHHLQDLIHQHPDIGLKMTADLLHRLREANRRLKASSKAIE